MSQLSSGFVLKSRYKIIGLIGAGGMGAVYLADDQRLAGRRCAIKEQLLNPGDTNQVGRNQFQQEASLLAQLDHPGLPKVSDYFIDETLNRDYLVMDYVPGKNLEAHLQQARRDNTFLPEATVLAWFEQLCAIVGYLHSHQPVVLHRDIKPANLKLTPDERLKLVDFGLAKPFDPADPSTVTGLQGIGSLPYTPLEQYVGHLGHTDVRTDIYALGATLYHLLTNQTPPSAHDRFLNPNSLIDPQAINPDLSQTTNAAILAAMKLHPDERPPSMAAWCALLQGHVPPKAPPAQNLPRTASTWRDLLKENALLVLIAIALLALALWMTFGG